MPEIRDLIFLLEKYDTRSLNDLRRQYPRYRAYLEPDGVALVAKANVTSDEYRFRLNVCKKGLEGALSSASLALPQLVEKLKRLRNLELINQIIIFISGATILSMVRKDLGNSYNWVKYIAPSLVLISSVITIIVKNRSVSFFSGNQNLYQLVSSLGILMNTANYLTQDIDIIQEIDSRLGSFDVENAKRLIGQSNTLAKEIMLLLSKTTFS